MQEYKLPEKQNILIISDIVVSHTGVANQSAEVAKALFNKGYGVYQIGVAITEPGKKLLHTFPTGEQVTIYTDNVYDNVPLLLNLIQGHSIKAIILVTDPHKFAHIWFNFRTIRSQVPIIYWNLWDTNLLPSPKSKKPHYNEWIYESCDSLPCISQQSENFVKQIVSALPTSKQPRVSYIPHGSNDSIFKPLSKEAIETFRTQFFQGKQYDYVVLFNSRNQTRKKACDLIYAWRLFTDELTPEQAGKVALVLHTEPVSVAGTDLNQVILALAPETHIFLDNGTRTPEQLNIIYNIADVTFSPSNAEGFGLSAQESLCAGTPIAATVTGGLQDSIGFFDEQGNRIKFDKDFTSNNTGKYRSHGEWSYPLFPDCQSVVGSPDTAYLFDDDVTHQTIKKGLQYWYNMTREERKARGLKGREWCKNQGMTSTALAESITKEVAYTIANHKKLPLFELFQA